MRHNIKIRELPYYELQLSSRSNVVDSEGGGQKCECFHSECPSIAQKLIMIYIGSTVIVYGVIKISLNAFPSVVLTEDNDSQESRKTRDIKRRGHFYGH